MKEFIPRLIAWEMTKKCKLSCTHCRIGDSAALRDEDLTIEESKRILDGIASHWKPIIIMTGGDPLLKDGFLELASYGNSVGLTMVVASCGYGITHAFAKKMKASGIRAVSLSIDGIDADTHDTFRNYKGSFDEVMRAASILKRVNLPFQINTTVTKKNAYLLQCILMLAKKIGAAQFHPFMFVPTGKGKDIAQYSLSADEYEKILTHIHTLSIDNPDIKIKPTCAPQYNRIVLQNNALKEIQQAELGSGCMGGKSFAFISSIGEVKICGFLNSVAGKLRDHNLDFNYLWHHADLFKNVRDLNKCTGVCGRCDYRAVCGGCRARAYEEKGDYLEDDPLCTYSGNRQSASCYPAK